jgi:peptidoglycan-associated lipoprotein
MKSTVLVVQGILLVSLAAGCARTPAATTAAAPPPSGTSTTVSPGSRSMDGGDGTRQAAGGGSTSRPRVDGFRVAPTGSLTDVYFEFDKYELTADATGALDANAEWLKANPKHLVLIEGHCDERGTVAYNLALGERRAKATQNYLAARGVPAGRISIVSYGEEKPQCPGHTEACWTKNRRAHFMVKPQ